jgi:2-aminoethylphosphonate-pyruvate transaminase
MEAGGGKWRFTSPTHVLLAFEQALVELAEEGGIPARFGRYKENHRVLVAGMRGLGFRTLLRDEHQAPIITSFLFPGDDVVGAPEFEFFQFYAELKARRFVIYPGKVTDAETFRIGNIGHVFPDDMAELTNIIGEVMGGSLR